MTEERYPGPCVVCGGGNYLMSMGGPTICPACDAGHYTSATVYRQTQELRRLRAELDRVHAESEARREALAAALWYGAHWMDAGRAKESWELHSAHHENHRQHADAMAALFAEPTDAG